MFWLRESRFCDRYDRFLWIMVVGVSETHWMVLLDRS